jgi:hypothetical protein
MRRRLLFSLPRAESRPRERLVYLKRCSGVSCTGEGKLDWKGHKRRGGGGLRGMPNVPGLAKGRGAAPQQGYASCDWTVAWSVRNAQLNSAVVVAGSTAVAVGLVCMYVCMHIYVYCTCVHVCACVYVCVCVCVCVYIHIDIDIYIGVISLSGLARPGAVFTFFFYFFLFFFILYRCY